MNPINLLLPDGTPSKVWACGECKLTCRDQRNAETCCTLIPCKFCGEPTDAKFRYSFDTAEHDHCEMAERRKRADERMARAEKLETWDGWVYEWGGGGHQDGYHESVEAFVEHLEENDELKPADWPDWVYIAESRPGCTLDVSDILENACSDGYEDMDSDLSGVKELEAAIEAFNDANEGVLVYEADCKKAVRVPKPTTAPGEEMNA